jgi:hypothetical protein
VSDKTGVALTCDKIVGDRRFTCRARDMKAGELLYFLAKTLRLKWYRTQQGFHLAPDDEAQRIVQQQAAAAQHEMRAQAQYWAFERRRAQAREFFWQLLGAPPLTDDDVKRLAEMYPDVAHSIERSSRLHTALKIVTHLSSAQLAEAAGEGLRLTRQQIEAMGGMSQPDLIISEKYQVRMRDVEELWIRFQPDGVIVFAYKSPGEVLHGCSLDAGPPQPFDPSKFRTTPDHDDSPVSRTR